MPTKELKRLLQSLQCLPLCTDHFSQTRTSVCRGQDHFQPRAHVIEFSSVA